MFYPYKFILLINVLSHVEITSSSSRRNSEINYFQISRYGDHCLVTALVLADLHKTYPGGVRALRGLNLTINEGEIYGLIGPNGAGKSTTLKITVGLLKPDKGGVLIYGRSVMKNRVEALRLTSYVPENPVVFKNLTVKEFLRFITGLRNIRWEEIADYAEYLVEGFSLSEKENTMLYQLSRGMLQKVLVTAAFLVRPKLMVMDEPMAGMDPEAQHFFKKEVKRLVSSGATALISSHLLDMVERFCTRVGIINKGRLVAEGTIEEIKRIASEESSLEEVFLKIVKG